jgi:hypothetical protein
MLVPRGEYLTALLMKLLITCPILSLSANTIVGATGAKTTLWLVMVEVAEVVTT